MARRVTSLDGVAGPADMAADAARLAADDSGAGSALLEAAGSVRSVDVVTWSYQNFPAEVARRVGAHPRQLLKAATGGNSPQMLVNDAARSIAAGQVDVVLLAGAEAMSTRALARREPRETRTWLDWGKPDPNEDPPDVVGDETPGSNDYEMANHLAIPTQVYPLLENALWLRSGEEVERHREAIARMWSRFSAVAAGHPHAWTQQRFTADEIATASPTNRMVGFPYTKLMNANMYTDQAAAVILCSVEAARSHGISEDRWVFPWAGADGNDRHWVSERDDLTQSPAIAACGRSVLAGSGLSIDDVAHLDLYSCFPSAVQIAGRALGVNVHDPTRQLTVTGGLTFFGGPINNYVTHSIATMADVLRADPGSMGLVTALGWYVTKHSMGLYSTDPPPSGFRWESVQAEVDALRGRAVDAGFQGQAGMESFVVMHDRYGEPATAVVSAITGQGTRVLATSTDESVMKMLMSGSVHAGDTIVVADGTARLG